MMEHSSGKLWSLLPFGRRTCDLLTATHSATYLHTNTHTLASLASQTAAVVALADLTRLEEKMNTPEVRAYFVPWQMSDKRDASM